MLDVRSPLGIGLVVTLMALTLQSGAAQEHAPSLGSPPTLRLDREGKLRWHSPPSPGLVDLPAIPGIPVGPWPKLRPQPWWTSPEVGWTTMPFGLGYQDPWAPYYGRSSWPGPFGPQW